MATTYHRFPTKAALLQHIVDMSAAQLFELDYGVYAENTTFRPQLLVCLEGGDMQILRWHAFAEEEGIDHLRKIEANDNARALLDEANNAVARATEARLSMLALRTFAWDEVSNTTTIASGPTLAVGEKSGDWTRKPDAGPLRVYMSERGHVALEVDANSETEAAALFALSDVYREHTVQPILA